MKKIEVKNMTKEFKGIAVLDNINLKFESNKIYGLYGRNGSGKSVFLKLLCGIYAPTKGEILYDDKDINKGNNYPDNVRVLIEKPSFFSDLSGYDNLKLLAEIQNKISDKEINEALKIVNLYEEKDKKYSKYSLGMKPKLGIAEVIMENPDTMLLDEAFNGIENATVNKFINYFLEQKDKIIIISTHIKDDLIKLTKNVYYFDDSKIIEASEYETTK